MDKTFGKEINEILLGSRNAVHVMDDNYDEYMSEFSMLEIWIFCVYFQISKVKDKEFVKSTILQMFHEIYSYDKSGMDMYQILKHLDRRLNYYRMIIPSTEDTSEELDLDSLYSAWYKYPFKDENPTSTEPKDPKMFRNAVNKMLDRLKQQ